jgi:hypothetical protein
MTCRNCLVSDAGAATWGTIIVAGANLGTINVGGCYALVSASTACGKAIQNLFDCRLEACSGCADDATMSTCIGAVASGPACKPIADAIATACAGAPSTIDATCQPPAAKYVFDGPAAKQCVGP